MILVETWDKGEHGPMSEDAIKETLESPSWYRVSKSRYPAGTSFPAHSRQGQVFVLAGRCRYTLADGSTVILGVGDIGTIPEGKHDFAVEGDAELEQVWVWKLPPEFRGR